MVTRTLFSFVPTLYLLCTYFAASESALSAECGLSEKVNTLSKSTRRSPLCTYFRASNLHKNVNRTALTSSFSKYLILNETIKRVDSE